MEKIDQKIVFDGPFSFEHTFKRHHRTTETLQPMAVFPEENRFKKWIYLDHQPFLLDVHVRETADGKMVCLNNEVNDRQYQKTISPYLNRMFGLDNNMESFYIHFQNHGKLHTLLHRFHGMRVLNNPDLFETMVDTIIGQQVNLKFAATLKERLIRSAGKVYTTDQRQLSLFPQAEDVARLDYDQLRALSFSQRKAEYIIDFARCVVNEEVRLDALWLLSNEEVNERLLPLRGVGVWTIECLMLFGLNRSDVLPASDIGLRNAVKNVYQLEVQPQTDEIRRLATEEDWHPWEGYITFYLWQFLSSTD